MLLTDPFTGIVGHEAARRVLGHALAKPHHAYLIMGAKGLGTHALAERFVRALLGMEEGRALVSHPDLILFARERGEEGAPVGLTVPVEQVRKARERLAQKPVAAPRLVAYVPEADRLGIDGANALLKSMEEPACPTVFVLVAHTHSRIPATVKSRLVSLTLGPVLGAAIASWLLGKGIPEAECREAVRRAAGRPGMALRWAMDPEERRRVAEAGHVMDTALEAASAGHMLAAFDAEFRKADASDDALAAWGALCDALAQSLRDRFADAPVRAAHLAKAVVAAQRNIGGPVSPRVWFELALLTTP